MRRTRQYVNKFACKKKLNDETYTSVCKKGFPAILNFACKWKEGPLDLVKRRCADEEYICLHCPCALSVRQMTTKYEITRFWEQLSEERLNQIQRPLRMMIDILELSKIDVVIVFPGNTIWYCITFGILRCLENSFVVYLINQ